jgi:2-polyprenyl-3-methyl-5-hydroxy-6-metoxy-1,4-benzoquinol methylase
MRSDRARGTEGYADNAASLIRNWQRLSFSDKPQAVLDLVPTAASMILDVGAGIGVDASAMAAMGHHVVAVEPTDELRLAGMALYPSAQIEWIADSLPDLDVLRAGDRFFDLILLSAVWMHLDEPERQRAMPRIATMLLPGGRVIMSLRHGPVPQGRRMFDVSAGETIHLAKAQHLQPILRLETQSVQQVNRLAGVTWTHLAFSSAR